LSNHLTLIDLGQGAEGVKTAKVVKELAKKFEVELPVCEEVYRVLYENETPKTSLNRLLSRILKKEFENL